MKGRIAFFAFILLGHAILAQENTMKDFIERLKSDYPQEREDAMEGILKRWKDWADDELNALREGQSSGAYGCNEAVERITTRRSTPSVYSKW